MQYARHDLSANAEQGKDSGRSARSPEIETTRMFT